MKIGIISDTHGLIREDVLEELKGCKWIIHAGDIGGVEILETLKSICPVIAVKGNNDKQPLSELLNVVEEINIWGFNIVVAHEEKDIPKDLREVDLVITGHSHKYKDEYKNDIRYINPGSCGKRRFSLPLTMAIAKVDSNKLLIEKIDL